jgi:hypothetical protein
MSRKGGRPARAALMRYHRACDHGRREIRQGAAFLLALLIAGCASSMPSDPGIKRLDGSRIESQELIIFPDTGMGVMLLTNSANGESSFKELLEVSIADVYTPWEWQNYVPYDHLQ